MLKILINAYACSPNMGSEPGMAWNWCLHLANYCELHIITEGEFRDKIEETLPQIPQGKNMRFYYNPLSEEIRRMCWNQGDWRFYGYYKKWQYKTYEQALEIIKHTKIDAVHQLNMIGFREPGYLWKIDDKPFIWGPVDAKIGFPPAYLKGAGVKSQFFNHLKNTITKLQLRYASRVHKAASKAGIVIAASSNAQYSIENYFRVGAFLLNETGCNIKSLPLVDKRNKPKLDLLWVGKLDFRKQLSLAIRALEKTKNKNIKLHIVGGGDANPYKELAVQLNVSTQCNWHGVISHSAVQEIMQQSDLLFFTSVAEGTPHVVLESISNNLPVLCFDTCGHGDSVNNKVGVKIQLSNPEQSVKEFAEQLNFLYSNREKLYEFSINCKERQQQLSWDQKAKQMVDFYDSQLKRDKGE